MFANMLDALKFHAHRSPNRIAIHDLEHDAKYSWGELEERVNRTSAFLVEELGLTVGDRVGIICGNDMSAIDLFFASCQTGIIIDVLNQHLNPAEIIQMVHSESPRALFFSGDFKEKAELAAASLSADCALICVDGECEIGQRKNCIDAYCSKGSFRPFRPDSEDIQMLLHTGGTTGFPKAAMLSYRYFLMNAVAEVASWKITESDCVYAAMPFFHTAGWNVPMLPTLLSGGSVVLTREFSPDVFFDLLEARRLSIFMGADMMLRMIASSPRFHEAEFSSMRILCCGASTVSQSSLDAFWSHGQPLLMGYGMTEYGPNSICPNVDFSLKENQEKPLVIGKPLMFTQVRIVKQDGLDAKAFGEGELYLSGALAFSGYWDNPSATEETVEDGWIKTGDIGYSDEEGYISICGRRKNMYISGGENVFPLEAERCIESCPGIKEACIIGVPDDHWGEVGKAVVVLEHGCDLTINDIKQWLDGRISTIKKPKYYSFASAIPTNAAGKRDMGEIKKRFGFASDGASELVGG